MTFGHSRRISVPRIEIASLLLARGNIPRARPMGCQHLGIFYERSQRGAATLCNRELVLGPTKWRPLLQSENHPGESDASR
eukprot:4906645-Pyramimonas_sp.AAC.1